jgi:hypothetical protein
MTRQALSLSTLGLTGLLALCATLPMPAWALYKVVGPDGKVTYTDRAPANQEAQALRSNGATAQTDTLPYELQKVVTRYPVLQVG